MLYNVELEIYSARSRRKTKTFRERVNWRKSNIRSIVFFRVVSRKLLKTGSGNRENLGFYVNSRNYI